MRSSKESYLRKQKKELLINMLKKYVIFSDNEIIEEMMDKLLVVEHAKNSFSDVSKRRDLFELLDAKDVWKIKNKNKIFMFIEKPTEFLNKLAEVEEEILVLVITEYINEVIEDPTIKALLLFCSYEDLKSGYRKYFDININHLIIPEEDEFLDYQTLGIAPGNIEDYEMEEEQAYFALVFIIQMLRKHQNEISEVKSLLTDMNITIELLENLDKKTDNKTQTNKFCREIIKK